MPLTKVSFSVIQVANNVTSTTVGNTTSIPSFTFDQNGVITSASNVTPSIANTQITGVITAAQYAANSISNTNIQTGAVENYMSAVGLDFGMRNRIINGAMRIDQRNAGANTLPSNGQYQLDRWQSNMSVSSKYSIQQDSSANTVSGFVSSLKATSTSAYSAGAGDYFTVTQQIEGFNTADLAFGTALAKPVTLSFRVRSSLTGTFGGALTNGDYDRSYPFTYTISVANTWEYKTITISGDTAGTWLTGNLTGLQVHFGLGSGATYGGTAGAWVAGLKFTATGTVSLVGTLGATWYVTGVQLEEGSVPTPFEYRHQGTELNLCKRYFAKMTAYSGAGAYTGFGAGYITATNAINAYVKYPVTMRGTHDVSFSTFSVFASGTSGTVSSFAVYNGTDSALLTAETSTSPFTLYQGGLIVGTTAGTSFLAFSSEL